MRVESKEPLAASQSLAPHPSPLAPLLHGEAVAMGMMCAARLAQRLGRVDAAFTARLRGLLQTFGLPTDVPKLDPEQILNTMMYDKKVEHGQLRLVLPSCIGRVELVGDINHDDVQAILSMSDA